MHDNILSRHYTFCNLVVIFDHTVTSWVNWNVVQPWSQQPYWWHSPCYVNLSVLSFRNCNKIGVWANNIYFQLLGNYLSLVVSYSHTCWWSRWVLAKQLIELDGNLKTIVRRHNYMYDLASAKLLQYMLMILVRKPACNWNLQLSWMLECLLSKLLTD